ncbi:hypothetical protein PDE_08461 [Penicillium oxalicum 114-2]|uniref:Uncharacterized protein n=1 Tax=Penicillium oxalicum (strain 114-2 / CGMCC 5302) TaxID=933388 RepID=S7ZSU5_PENO1|nr:hypothetical protein PDE_08461 [Penicillium oxalicum 114-2]
MPFTAKLRFGSEGSRGSSLAQAPTDQESTTILETLFVIFLLPSPGICRHAILTMIADTNPNIPVHGRVPSMNFG